MIVRGFKSVIWAATVGGAALSCYMVSLQVATERAELTKVERQIIAAKRDIRSLQTELGTRGRLSQLEHWNAEVLALSAPSSAQFLSDGVKLARFEQRDTTIEERSAQVRMAALATDEAPAETAPKPAIVRTVAPAPTQMAAVVHRASFTPDAGVRPLAAARPAARPKQPAPASALDGDAEPAARPAAAKARTEAKAAPEKAAAKAASRSSERKPRASRIDSTLVAEIKTGLGQGGGDN